MKQHISQQAIANIFAHVQQAWNYSPPTGTIFENAFIKGVKPFYSDAQRRGGSLTWVDAQINQDAYDLKGYRGLNIYKVPPKKYDKQKYYLKEVTLANGKTLFVKIPKFLEAIVRRPNEPVDLTFKGDPLTELEKLVNNLESFAHKSGEKISCSQFYYCTCLYGEKNNIRAAFITIDKWSTPKIVRAELNYKKNGQPRCYNGYDINDNWQCRVIPFSSGSVNFYKRYETMNGYLVVWETSAVDDNLTLDSEVINIT